MDLKLKKLNIRYEFFDALEASLVKEKYNEYEGWCALNSRNVLMGKLPSYACLMSHCRFFQDNPLGDYFVLEDDVYFHKRFFHIVESLPDNIMDGYDVLYLGYNNYQLSEQQMSVVENGGLLMPVDKNIMTHGNYGIIYSPSAMKYFKEVMVMDMPHEKVLPNDNIIWRHAAYHLRAAIVNPSPVIPEVRMSNIRESRDMIKWCEHRLIKLEDYMDLDLYENYAGLD